MGLSAGLFQSGVFALLAASVASANGLSTQPGIEVYGNLPAISGAVISPDGASIATLENLNGAQVVVIRGLDNDSARATRVESGKARSIAWSGPNHVLTYISDTVRFGRSWHQVESGMVASINARDQDAVPVQMMGTTKGLDLQVSLDNVVAHLWNPQGEVYMAAETRSMSFGNSRDLYKVDGGTGEGVVYARGTYLTDEWIALPGGKVIGRIDYDDTPSGSQIFTPPEAGLLSRARWNPLFDKSNKTPSFSYLGVDPSERELIVGVKMTSGLLGLRSLSLTTGDLGPVIFEHPLVDIDAAIIEPYSGVVIGARYVDDMSEQVFFDQRLQAVLNGARKALPGSNVVITSWSQDRSRFTLASESGQDSGTYWLMDVAKGAMIPVGRPYPGVKPEHVAPVKGFTYKTRDGKDIRAYLARPPGAAAGPLPLVVLPHGGPEARDDASFDWLAQFLTTRGYGVLKMNFRGSSGYGADFVKAGYGEWGRKMQDDVTDAVKAVIDQGAADPARVCIVGASYGGYAALAGAAFTPELYRCAVSLSGLSDLREMIKWLRNRYGDGGVPVNAWRNMLKDKDIDISTVSPARFAENVVADVLLIHGKQDTVVPFKQSEIMHKALRATGKNVELVALEGEDHWMSRAATRMEMLGAIEKFLSRHLGSPAEAR